MSKQGPSLKNGLIRRLQPQKRFDLLGSTPLLQFVVFAVFVGTIVFIITGFGDQRADYRDYEISQVAPNDIVATREFSFAERDQEATEKRREDAAQKIPAVFDWDESKRTDLRDKIARAFALARQDLADSAKGAIAASEPKAYEQILTDNPDGVGQSFWIERIDSRTRLRLSRENRATFQQTLGSDLSDVAFTAIARAGFDSNIEHILSGLVADLMESTIVRSRSELAGRQNVYLRRFLGETLLLEYEVENVSGSFLPLEDTSNQIRLASAAATSELTDKGLKDAIITSATKLVEPNTFFNPTKTAEKQERARTGVTDIVISESFQRGQVIVDKGHVISERHLRIMERMTDDTQYLDRTQVVLGILLLTLLVLVVLFGYGRRNITKFDPTTKDVVFMGSVLLSAVLLMRLSSLAIYAIALQLDFLPPDAWLYAIPIAWSAMLVRLVLNSEYAIVFSFVVAALVGVVAENSFAIMIFTALSCLVGSGTVRQVKNRMSLLWSGVFVGAINVVIVAGFLLLSGNLFEFSTIGYMAFAFIGGVASGLAVVSLLAAFEPLFAYTTDIQLLELANLNHPALRELIMHSPGSYHHSMMVGSLCEAAAESIGCNPLLARVGAYYHDIGKAKNPGYFAENQQGGINPHDKLKPNMSALIIKAHVKDGLEMAKTHKLPDVIQDFIAQHHGTSLIAYFFHRAKDRAGDNEEIREEDYRYPGPKPQTRETAICLLADGVEAASRAMKGPTPAKLKGLVQKMINNAFTDGQLDECDLTLKDLNKIADAFNRILNGIYHHRPEYPERKKEQTDVNNDAKPKAKSKAKAENKKRPTLRTAAIEDTASQDATRSLDRERESGIIDPELENAEEPEDVNPDAETPDDEDEKRKPLPRLGSPGQQ